MKLSNIKLILHLESMSFFILSTFIYYSLNFSWKHYFLFFLTPDISIAGYLINKQIGSYIYNTFHTYIFPILLLLIGFNENEIFLKFGLIWIAHIAIDRFFGFGLKYKNDFKSTHLNKL